MFLIVTFSSINSVNAKSNYLISDVRDTIFWSSNRKLIWEDFMGIPDTHNSILVASTHSGISFKITLVKNSIPIINVKSYFIKSLSWKKIKNKLILTHEQLHFDINELYARKIRKAVDSLQFKKNIELDDYKKIYLYYNLKCDEYNDLYDKEVYFNDSQQQQWIKKVGAELLRLKKYEDVPEE